MKKKLFLLCLTGAMAFCEPIKAESVTNLGEAISGKSFAHIGIDTFPDGKHRGRRSFDHIGNFSVHKDTLPDAKSSSHRRFDHIGNFNVHNDTLPDAKSSGRRAFDHIGSYGSGKDTLPDAKSSSHRRFDHIGNFSVHKDTLPDSKSSRRRSFDHIGNYNISSENQNLVILYPNPTINNLNLRISVNKQEKIQLKILDNTGRILKQEMQSVAMGSTTITYATTNLPKGVYYIHLLGETINERKQFIKQ